MDLFLIALIIFAFVALLFLATLDILEMRWWKEETAKAKLFRDFDQSVNIGNHK